MNIFYYLANLPAAMYVTVLCACVRACVCVCVCVWWLRVCGCVDVCTRACVSGMCMCGEQHGWVHPGVVVGHSYLHTCK